MLLTVAGCFALAACTQIRVTEGGKASISYRFGVLRVQPDPSAPLVMLEISGLGLVPTTNGASLGWAKQWLVMSGDPQRCQLVVVIHNADELAAIREQLSKAGGSLEHVCEVNTHEGG